MSDASVPPRIFTLGHSTRPWEEFVALLRGHGVEQVFDVRTVPRSRHNPQYEREAMAPALDAAGLGYRHLPGLGGLRRRRADAGDSVNLGWKNASFRSYADYMQTPEFLAALAEMEELSRQRLGAVMCAEAVPWRCHRSLIGDALGARGWEVLDIVGAGAARPHRPTPFLRVEAGNPPRLTYPPHSTPAE